MKFVTAISFLVAAAAVANATPVERDSSPNELTTIMERDTPTCWFPNSVCSKKCVLRGKSGGSCVNGVCTCNSSKRDEGKRIVIRDSAVEEQLQQQERRADAEGEARRTMAKRITCQIGGMVGAGDAACSLSCEDAGKKQGYCNEKQVCVCSN